MPNLDKDTLGEALGTQELDQILTEETGCHRQSIYPPMVTLRLFIDQILSTDQACQEAVSQRVVACVVQRHTEKMFRKSPCLDHLPVLSLHSEQLSAYRLRRSQRDSHFCTSEVAAMCLALAGQTHAAQTLSAYLAVFTDHYLKARQQLPLDLEDADHRRLRDLRLPRGCF